jgi:hypothetical protein
MRFENQTFTSGVTLDYNEFVNCTIRDCVVAFHGGGFTLTGTTITNVRFNLGDAANNTLAFLQMVRAATNGEKIVNELITNAVGVSRTEPAN